MLSCFCGCPRKLNSHPITGSSRAVKLWKISTGILEQTIFIGSEVTVISWAKMSQQFDSFWVGSVDGAVSLYYRRSARASSSYIEHLYKAILTWLPLKRWTKVCVQLNHPCAARHCDCHINFFPISILNFNFMPMSEGFPLLFRVEVFHKWSCRRNFFNRQRRCGCGKHRFTGMGGGNSSRRTNVRIHCLQFINNGPDSIGQLKLQS